MLLKFSNVGLRMMTHGNFHAKGYMFKTAFGRNLIVGCSNLTDSALCSNKEWNLKISALAESGIMFQSHAEFEKEYQEAVEVDADFINQYVSLYNEKSRYSRGIQVDIHYQLVNQLHSILSDNRWSNPTRCKSKRWRI